MPDRERQRRPSWRETRRRLLRQREEIADRLRTLRLELLRSEAEVEGESEVGRTGSELDVDIALADGDVDALRRIDEKLMGLDCQPYGICSDCGAPIGAARLHAVPFATRCRDCEAARESASPNDLTTHLSPDRGP
jgi:RNA polymerase-binding transcription factor DksA